MHAEMVKQYESGSITAKEFCGEVWIDLKVLNPSNDVSWVTVDRDTMAYLGSSHYKTQDEAWEAAASITIDRLEEIRQLDAEIGWVQTACGMKGRDHLGGSIVVRLQAVRAGLTRGMKEPQ